MRRLNSLRSLFRYPDRPVAYPPTQECHGSSRGWIARGG